MTQRAWISTLLLIDANSKFLLLVALLKMGPLKKTSMAKNALKCLNSQEIEKNFKNTTISLTFECVSMY